MEERIIIYVSLEPFYASIEQRDRPDLRGLPIAVCFGGGIGTVASASREAAARGVYVDQPTELALRVYPDLHFVDGDYSNYQDVWLQLKHLFGLFTNEMEIERKGCVFLDMTHASESGVAPVDMATQLSKAIAEDTQLHPVIGVSHNRFLAKAATFHLRPGGVKYVPSQCVEDVVRSLTIDQLWLLSDNTRSKLHSLGMAMVNDLKGYSKEELESMLGAAEGGKLHHLLKGDDDTPLRIPGIPSRSHTFALSRQSHAKKGNNGGQQLTLDLFGD